MAERTTSGARRNRAPAKAATERFKELDYEGFRALARDKSLSVYEKIGFPRSYREGQEAAIFADILAKVPELSQRKARVLDIGCGCSELAHMFISHAAKHSQSLTMIDSEDMLDLLPVARHVRKAPGYFPKMPEFLPGAVDAYDAVIVYSVLHYVFAEGNLFGFLDAAVSCLRPGGALLVGDIPNISLRKRFFHSETGVRFHQKFMRTKERRTVAFAVLEKDQIDDAVLAAIVQRYRSFGYNAYVLPQSPSLPMANRREDVLIRRL